MSVRRYSREEDRRPMAASHSTGERLVPIEQDSREMRMSGQGFVPCGLCQTWTSCPACGKLLGRFRSGPAGMKWFNPTTAVTVMTDAADGSVYWCRSCRTGYR